MRDLVLKVYGPHDSRPSRTLVWTPFSLRHRGRMAEPEPGDWHADTVPFRRRSAPGADREAVA